jgi:hypothetical protein
MTQPGPQGLPKGSSQTPDQIAAGLSEAQRRVLTGQTLYNERWRRFFIRGDKRVLLRLRRLGLLNDYISPSSLTPLGLAVRALISKEKDNGI